MVGNLPEFYLIFSKTKNVKIILVVLYGIT